MADAIRIEAERRTEFGKGAARRIRRADKIPAVMYGHGGDPQHITLPGHDTMMALKHVNAFLAIVIDGKEEFALAKDVQRAILKPWIEHVDLVVVKKGEKVTVDVPVHVEGEAGPETIVTVDNQTLEVEADVINIPESLVVSVEGMEAGTQIHASDVEMPEGSSLVSDPELLVVNITEQISEEALEAELAEAEAEVGIEQDESEDAESGEAEGDAESGEAAEGDSEEKSEDV
ncbi:50S ribosomal protein L25/general stress protein Ctc [Marihabitans asiaticum]|uniref:Large ribosomal subunit protein bL25 n=1 Tax=Marihabitans asiaticum TaxID=415218 RepID=A0A560WD59_9MICO|nr:50S ribosomal protein L25/general stress protein Ctc [Marihabitans asiaticum]TWD15609.1 LSU ribosomal protein L25P [Marihabitans asiaticum]